MSAFLVYLKPELCYARRTTLPAYKLLVGYNNTKNTLVCSRFYAQVLTGPKNHTAFGAVHPFQDHQKNIETAGKTWVIRILHLAYRLRTYLESIEIHLKS